MLLSVRKVSYALATKKLYTCYVWSVDVVMFVGGVVAATVELISLDSAISRPVHSYGTVSRWIVMYP